MAEPVSPVVPGHDINEVVFGKGQLQYQELPAIILPTAQGEVVTRWQLSEEERARIAQTGEIWLCALTFNQPPQPLIVTALPPVVEGEGEQRIIHLL